MLHKKQSTYEQQRSFSTDISTDFGHIQWTYPLVFHYLFPTMMKNSLEKLSSAWYFTIRFNKKILKHKPRKTREIGIRSRSNNWDERPQATENKNVVEYTTLNQPSSYWGKCCRDDNYRIMHYDFLRFVLILYNLSEETAETCERCRRTGAQTAQNAVDYPNENQLSQATPPVARITSRNNTPISNYGGGFRCKSEYP
ncbi:hypothetical protein AGLY_008538 [Aphis glycines]|uniref:Uncharacterized protein n=1 Tax=Aphis glycines TaxID=307491 RepID=A0A6G0TKA2_APHGL|nr:hypothetical protein AGLY_008538 [Aphis glycines]